MGQDLRNQWHSTGGARLTAGALSCLVAIATVPLPAARAEPATPWPTQVTAVYSLHFTGFGELGKFKFQSRIQGNQYTITGNADVKVPLIYTWSSTMNGGGNLAGEEPHPTAYTFSSHGKPIIGGSKSLNVRMGFKDRAVEQLSVVPPGSTGAASFVPLKPEHLKNILDPLTAVMVTTRAKAGSPCGRRIPIFDGKQRFDLITSPAGQQRVPEARPSGQPAIGYVCKVRYIPVAGFKDSEDHRNMVNNSTAEIALRPVPSANLLVPYRITVATKWGTGSMLLQRMDIVTPEQKQIALVH
jgi:hypothetical protein